MTHKTITPQLASLLGYLKCSITGDNTFCSKDVDWGEVYKIAKRQGVAGILFKGVQNVPNEYRPQEVIYLTLLGMTSKIQQKNQEYLSIVNEFATVCSEHDIRIVALKGLVCLQYYPKDCLRYCGDFDCYLCGDFERGNNVGRSYGNNFDPCYYKHSEFQYKGITVENHKYFLNIRGKQELKELERHLEMLVDDRSEEERRYYRGTLIEMPCADFNALFLMVHAFCHFLDEGTNLKQICDWAVFLQKEQESVGWESYNKWMDIIGMTTFSNAMNAIVRDYLGVAIHTQGIVCDNKYSARILMDAVYDSKSLHNKGYGHVRKLLEITKAMMNSRWKYREIYHRSLSLELFRAVFGFVFERNPKI